MNKAKSSSNSKNTKSPIPDAFETQDGRLVTPRGLGADEELYIVFKKDGIAFTANAELTPILEAVGKLKGFGPVGLCG